jgi:phage shock protein PspC (stress-responsive transcriptional regulator)
MNGRSDKNRVALIIGTVLVCLGLWQLLRHFFGNILSVLLNVIGLVVGILGALAIIAVGILLVIAARRDKLNFPNGKKLYRSTRNRKIAGVCGGIAEYLSVDHATVRIITLVLAVAAWYLIIPLYLILWVALPPDTQSFNTWI